MHLSKINLLIAWEAFFYWEMQDYFFCFRGDNSNKLQKKLKIYNKIYLHAHVYLQICKKKYLLIAWHIFFFHFRGNNWNKLIFFSREITQQPDNIFFHIWGNNSNNLTIFFFQFRGKNSNKWQQKPNNILSIYRIYLCVCLCNYTFYAIEMVSI